MNLKVRALEKIVITKNLSKKYYSVSEIVQFLNIQHYQLRYLENNISDLSILKIKNRRYYTEKDLEFLKNYLNSKKTSKSDIILVKVNFDRIEALITKFKVLSTKIASFLKNSTCNNNL